MLAKGRLTLGRAKYVKVVNNTKLTTQTLAPEHN